MPARMDMLSLICIIIGSIMVYGSKHVMKVLNIAQDEIKVVIFKLVGLVIACIGFFRILDIF